MINTIANYLTRSKIKADNARRKKQFLSWNKIEKIALVLDEKNLNKSEIDKLIEGSKKYIEVFYVEPQSKLASYGDWKCFINKNKNLLGLPSGPTKQLISNKKFDILINASNNYKLYSANLISNFEAEFKSGHSNLYGELDLIVEKRESQNLQEYLKELIRYLEMIRTE